MSVLRVIKQNRKKLIEFSCDQCGKIFERRYSILAFFTTKLTFCSRECHHSSLRKGGISDQKARKTSMKRYGSEHHMKSEEVRKRIRNDFFKKHGVEHNFQLSESKEKAKQTNIKRYGVEIPSQSEEVKKKASQTCIEKYGVKSPRQSKDIKDKCVSTCLKNYGVEHPMQSNQVREKSKKTCLEKYGVRIPTQSNEIKEKVKSSCLENYGVDNPFKSDIVKEKIKRTLLKKYGVDNSFKSDVIKEKIKRTLLKRYGVENPSQSKEIQSKIDWKLVSKKAHETMKRNGTYGKSKIEDQFYEFLCKKFGKENVERQVRINDWSIDFYIKSENIYIQFDGVYWHGLNRNIEMIKESNIPRDKVIYKTYLRDQEQNKWFEKNNIKLKRITDIEFKNTINSKSDVTCIVL